MRQVSHDQQRPLDIGFRTLLEARRTKRTLADTWVVKRRGVGEGNKCFENIITRNRIRKLEVAMLPPSQMPNPVTDDFGFQFAQ